MEMKKASSPSPFPSTDIFHFNEERWLSQMRGAFMRQSREPKEGDVDAGDAVLCIFDVPKALLSTKPEAYTPHIFAVGPYHKRRRELYDMERYKVDAACRAEGEVLGGLKFEQLVDRFTHLESSIRAYYHRYLDYNKQTLAWMMAIDACFVLMFLRSRYSEGKVVANEPAEMAWVNNAILRDIMMLENQIPLCLLKEIASIEALSELKAVGIDELWLILKAFIIEVSPFRMMKNAPEKHHHLLAILYDVVTPKWEDPKELFTLDIEYGDPNSGAGVDIAAEEEAKVKPAFGVLLKLLPSRFKKAKPLKFFQNSSVLNFLKQGTEKCFGSRRPAAANSQASIEEIRIPSVTDLAYVGVRFVPTSDGIEGIRFDAKTGEFHLPVIFLDDNTEVIMRNLVAYEATTVHRQLIFARYTELMNGIIDTEQDLQILRESRIMRGTLGNKKAVEYWNGMNKSVRANKVPQLDKEIIAVNEFYDRIWSVRTRRLMTRYLFNSWKLLTLLSAMLLLLMTGLQAFCSVYTCARWFSTVNGGKQ